MPYGAIKVDNITFTNGGADQATTVSGIYRAITSGVTVTGTVSGATIQGATVSGTVGIYGAGTVTAPGVAVGVGTTYPPGIYSVGTDQLAISINGTGRLFVDASGNVGIATSNPTSILQGSLSSSSTGFAISTPLPTIALNDSSGTTGTSYWGQLDATTYFYNKTNGDLIFGTNNTEKLRITAGGLVGVGTSSPGSVLDVRGEIRGGNGTIIGCISYSTRAEIGSISNHNLGFITNTTTQMLLDTSGRLGIGTTSPGYTLDVRPTGLGLARIGSQDNQAGLYISSGNGTSPFINFSTSTSTLRATIYAGASSDDLIFATGASGTERARIDSIGRVGIGTTAPLGMLEITGTSIPLLVQSINATSNYITHRHHSSGDIAYIGAGGGAAVTAGTASDYAIRANLGALLFATNGNSERARIDSSGNVGIGTSSPQLKLTVGITGTYGVIYQPAVKLQNTSSGGTVTSPTGLGAINWSVDGLYDVANIEAVRENPSNGTFSSLVFRTNPTNITTGAGVERMRIDSSGRVGIANTNPDNTLTLGDVGAISQDTNSLYVGANFSGVGVNFKKTGNYAQQLHFDTALGSIIFKNTSSTGTAGNVISFSERMRIDTSGRLLVGTSSASGAKVEISSSTDADGVRVVYAGAPAGVTGPAISFSNYNNSLLPIVTSSIKGLMTGGAVGSEAGALLFNTAEGGAAPTERMRIGSNGRTVINHSDNDDVLVLNSVATSGYSQRIGSMLFAGYAPNNTAARFLYCADTAAVRAEIRSNGGLANFQANDVNLSDRNVKKDISPAAGTWNCLKEWEIVNYRYKDQPDDADLNLGVIAQQVAESCPEVITIFQEAKEATEDKPAQEERLGVKEQQMYWMAIKALQEAQARIEALEADVALLKSA
jgi:hypothetical protein